MPSSGTVAAFAEDLFGNAYPFMFGLKNDIHFFVAGLDAKENTGGILTLLNHINIEFDEYHTKEKLVLFPLLEKLEAEGEKAESCSPFRNVKTHYTAILSLLVSLKDCSGDLEDEEAIAGLLSLVNQFEQSLIGLQISKDKNLYSKFKNCSHGCGKL